MILTEIVGAVEITGGAALSADHTGIGQIVGGSDVRAVLDDDGLHALCIGVGEGHQLGALLVVGQTGQHKIALALLDSGQSGVKVHVVDLQLQTQLLGDGSGDLNVDAIEAGAVHAVAVGDHLIGRELGVGGHDQLAGLDGLDLGGIAVGLVAGGGGGSGGGAGSGALAGISGTIAAAGGQQHNAHAGGEKQRKQFLHFYRSNKLKIFGWCFRWFGLYALCSRSASLFLHFYPLSPDFRGLFPARFALYGSF